MAEGSLWSDQDRARGVVDEVKTLKRWLDPYQVLRRRVDEARELTALLAEEPHPTADRVREALRPGDMVLTLGAGDVSQLAPKLLAELQAQGVPEPKSRRKP